ncbi:MAG: prepilin-type N-terminal cleavage/methylation domain-containing protein [Candidatus Omnitrophica bacterium]|nr:prepilin-type N-terminal cleavage/methylation domain-containing protein [Candidatus Omnitrophota bacterium]
MKRGFTMLEILIAVIVLGILTSVALVSYRGYQDRVAMMVDATNQKVLAAAVKIYAYDTSALPGSLSDLRSRDMDRAFALVTNGKRPYTMLVFAGDLFSQAFGLPTAEAQHLPGRYYNRDLKVLRCPNDKVFPTGFNASDQPVGGRSYEIAGEFQGKPLSYLLDPNNKDKTLVLESSEAGGPEFRHKSETAAVVTSPAGESGVWVQPGGEGDPSPPTGVNVLPKVGQGISAFGEGRTAEPTAGGETVEPSVGGETAEPTAGGETVEPSGEGEDQEKGEGSGEGVKSEEEVGELDVEELDVENLPREKLTRALAMSEARFLELEKLLPNLTDPGEIERLRSKMEDIRAKIRQIQEKLKQ